MIGSLGKFFGSHVSVNSTLSNTTRKNASQKAIKEEQEKNNNPYQKANVKNIQSSQIDALMKEKESIEKAKEDFSKNCGDTMDQKEYQLQLKEYDNQIEDINRQIQEARLEEQREKVDKSDSKNNKEADNSANSKSSPELSKNNTDDANELMNNLMVSSNYLKKSKSLNALKKSAASTKNVVDEEIKTDAGRGRINKYDIRLSRKLSDGIHNTEKELNKLGEEVNSKNKVKTHKEKNNVKNNDSIDRENNASLKKDIKNKIQQYSNAQNFYKQDNNLDYTA